MSGLGFDPTEFSLSHMRVKANDLSGEATLTNALVSNPVLLRIAAEMSGMAGAQLRSFIADQSRNEAFQFAFEPRQPLSVGRLISADVSGGSFARLSGLRLGSATALR
jgi:hypothetical protein